MPSDQSEPEKASWSVEGHPIVVSYAGTLMESIRHAAWEGLQKIPRRGLEIGGVLLGAREGYKLNITKWRPIECEHAEGPGFELSNNDASTLGKMLDEASGEAQSRGIEVLGWFHTHTRDGVFLSEADLDLHKRFFPEPWQVALVLRPHVYEPTRAGFFFREADGSIRTESSHKEFALQSRGRRLPLGFDPSDPRAGRPLRGADPEAPASRLAGPSPVASSEREESVPVSPSQAPVSSERPPDQPRWRRSWKRWLLATAALSVATVALAVFGLPLLDPAQPDPVLLEVRDIGGQLVLEWDRTAAPVLEAESATLRIVDGEADHEIQLTREEIQTGSLTYARRTDDVEFHLSLIRPDGEPVSEITRFLGDEYVRGPSSVDQDDPGEMEELQREVERLREQLGAEAARTSELSEAIRILRQRPAPNGAPSEGPASSR